LNLRRELLRDVGSTPGGDLITRMRTVSSVADAGHEDRNSDIWVHMTLHAGVPQIRLLVA
jgi:hypothetical protein